MTPLPLIDVAEEEFTLLREYAKRSPSLVIRGKAQAIVLGAQGVDLAIIANTFDRKERTIQEWFRNWRNVRMASVVSGYQGNDNAAKLTKEQKLELRETLRKPPSDYGIPAAFWDVPHLKHYTEATFRAVYESTSSYHALLSFCGLSFKYPDAQNLKRDDEGIKKRMTEIEEELQPLLHDAEWEVFCADEVRIEHEAEFRKAWLRKGERTVVKVDKKKQYQSYIGFLNQKTDHCAIFELAWQNQEHVLLALTELLSRHPDKNIAIVWDNAAFHKGKLIRQALQKDGPLERVHLVALPPYAPDHNPIERVWNAAKGAIANIQREEFSETKQAFVEHVTGRTYAYKLST